MDGWTVLRLVTFRAMGWRGLYWDGKKLCEEGEEQRGLGDEIHLYWIDRYHYRSTVTVFNLETGP
jgi:hypothetical protein